MNDTRSIPSRQILANVTRCANMLQRLSNLVASGEGLSGATWQLLAALVYAGADGLRLGDLARHASLSAPNITARVRKLETAGLAHRRRDPDDGRAQRVFSTPDAEMALAGLEEPADRIALALFSEFSPEELQRFSALSDRLLSRLDQLDHAGGQPPNTLEEALVLLQS